MHGTNIKEHPSLHMKTKTHLITSHSVILRTRNVSGKSCRENQNTHFVLSNFKNRDVYEVMLKNIVQRGQSTDGNMAHAPCILYYTPTHTYTHTLQNPHIPTHTHTHTLQNPHIHTHTHPHITKLTHTHTHTYT
jgi:hypothetical protein